MIKNKLFNSLSLLSVSVVIFIILALLMYTGIIGEYYGQLFVNAGIYIIVALSLNLITGFTGQLALGQAGFMSVGAYTTAICIMRGGLPLLPSILVGGLFAAAAGVIIGIPTLRLRGDYLAITTLGFAEIIRVIMINLEVLTGGAAGLKGVPSFSNTGDFVLDLIIKFAWIYSFVILTIVLVSNLIRSSTGRAIISIREDEIASNAMGINVAYYKVFSFTVSAFIAGVGGGLYAIVFGYLNPVMFGFMNSINFVVIVVLGGMGSITGTILSGVGFTFVQEWLRQFQDFRLVIFGFVLIFAMLFWRKGLMGSSEISVVQTIKNLMEGQYTPSNIYSRVSVRFRKKSKGVAEQSTENHRKDKEVK